MDFKPADILAFSGRGWQSRVIQGCTLSCTSHVGIVACAFAELVKRPDWLERLLLFESTTLQTSPCELLGRKVSGVQAHDPAARVAEYPGSVDLYRLTPEYAYEFDELRSRHLTRLLINDIGEAYDQPGALLSATWLLGALAYRIKPTFQRQQKFCDEYVASVLPHVGLLPISIPGRSTPGSLLRTLEASEVYQWEGKLK